MLTLAERLTQLRRKHGLSQNQLAKQIGSSRTVIGNYERSINTPSMAALQKLAKVFNVSMDYMIGEGAPPDYDREVLARMEELQQLPEDDRQRIYHYIDMVVRDSRARKAYTG